MTLSFAVRDAGICKVIDWSMKGGKGCRPATPTELEMMARIAGLEQQLCLLLSDVKARAASCSCGGPPLTREEAYHIGRAEALLAGDEPPEV